MKKPGQQVMTVALLLAALALPVLAAVLAVQGDWAPAAIVGMVWLATWWKGRHEARYFPPSLRGRRPPRRR